MQTSRDSAWVSGAAALLCCLLACGEKSTEKKSSANGGAAGAGAGGTLGNGPIGGILPTGGAGGNDGGSAGSSAGGAQATGGTPAAGGNGGGASGGASGAGGSAGEASLQRYKGVANSECADLATLNVAWWYNWTVSPGDCERDEFVPMISGKNEKTPGAVEGALSGIASAGYQTVLGFNEPNKPDQANLSVEQVLELWPSITSNASIRVGSPATSADAKAWFEEFMAAVEAQSLRVDFVAIHWYGWNAGSCDNANELENYVTWAEQFERPIWITEWGCMHESNPSAEVVENFYSAAIAMFDEHPMIERYAWYPWNTNNGLVDAGTLTDLGVTFAAAPAER